MKTQYLMAIDVGGGSGRCLLLDPETGAIKTAKRNWTHPVAPGTSGLGYSIDTNDILKKLGDASREVLAKAGAAPSQIAGIAASGMRNTIVVLDAQRDILLATPNRDARALGEGMVLGAERGKEFHTVTGHWPTPLFLGTRLIWMKNNAPDLFKRASVALSVTDWIAFLLSGNMVSERSQAGESLLFDLKRRQWAFDLIDSLGLPRSLFPHAGGLRRPSRTTYKTSGRPPGPYPRYTRGCRRSGYPVRPSGSWCYKRRRPCRHRRHDHAPAAGDR